MKLKFHQLISHSSGKSSTDLQSIRFRERNSTDYKLILFRASTQPIGHKPPEQFFVMSITKVLGSGGRDQTSFMSRAQSVGINSHVKFNQ